LPKAIDSWSVKVTKVQKDHGEKLGPKMKIAIVTAMCPSSMIESIYQDIRADTPYEDFLKKVKTMVGESYGYSEFCDAHGQTDAWKRAHQPEQRVPGQ